MVGHTNVWLKRGVSGAGKGDEGKVLPDAWERIAEESNEGHRLTLGVVLEVDGTLREESGLVGLDLIENKFAAVLRDHTRDERAVGDISEFCRPRMGVRGDHAAWSNEPGSCKT